MNKTKKFSENIKNLNLKLFIAIINNKYSDKYVLNLLANGADPNSIISQNDSKLLAKNFNIVKEETYNWCGQTPLVLAAKFGSLKKFRLLLENGANPNPELKSSYGPLEMAIISSNFSFYRKRLTLNNFLEKLSLNFSKNCVHKMSNPEVKVYDEMIKLLVKKYKSKITSKYIVQTGLSNNLKLLKFLCLNSNLLNKIHNHNGTPLHIIASSNKLGACKVMLECGANPYIKNSYNRNVLEVSQVSGSTHVSDHLSKVMNNDKELTI